MTRRDSAFRHVFDQQIRRVQIDDCACASIDQSANLTGHFIFRRTPAGFVNGIGRAKPGGMVIQGLLHFVEPFVVD